VAAAVPVGEHAPRLDRLAIDGDEHARAARPRANVAIRARIGRAERRWVDAGDHDVAPCAFSFEILILISSAAYAANAR
jgi:hypothetical protein